ncbi:LolA family protein [Streptomyces formicae]|uniref:Outer membrane lipoprotein carrier protein LolA n=1 Tax=Streptomyces formicae TaxID=1616117 RepID=A0ABY3WDP2_9ACTN|nr:sigma-E factor regulatory protein RseB domain-containing protein [Streptomyces formicae]UNM10684.1 outer membrane lipoprotein carrier protein LolA [Streptomyces formicae]
MAPNENAPVTEEPGEVGPARRKAARYLVPAAVAGVAAATIGLVPALAASGDPDLPEITAQELIEKIAASDVQQLSGTVKITTDLGLPSFAGLADSLRQGAGDGGSGASASPQDKLMELASGSHKVDVAADGPDRQRVALRSGDGEYSVTHNGDDVWTYDSASNEVVHGKDEGKDDGKGEGDAHEAPKELPTTPKALADEALKAADETTSVTVDGTARIAGRDAYQLVIKPKQSGSTIGSIKVAVDAENGVPLKFTLLPSDGGKAAVDAGFTKVDFSKPAASTFDFTPPKGAKVTEADELEGNGHEGLDGRKGLKEPKDGKEFEGLEDFNGLEVIGEGWTSIAELTVPGGEGVKAPKAGEGDVPPEAGQFLDALGDEVKGDFGTGTVFKTRLVNALMTDDGKVYVGAVTKDALVKAANEAK